MLKLTNTTSPSSTKLFSAVFALTLTLTCSGLARAADDVLSKYQDALQDFGKRNAADPAPIESALQKLEEIENKSADKDVNYDIFVLEARALYWKGVHLKARDQIMATHLKGQQKADAAVKVNPEYTEGYYYAGINLGRWGEANGIIPSLSKLGTLKAYMADASSHLTRAGDAGGTVDGYGPSRVIGRIYFKLPRVFGGSHKEAIKNLKVAYDNAKDLALNVVYYAETLNDGTKEEKIEAKRVLDELLAADPETINKDRIPESREEFKEARELRDQIQ